MGGEGLREGSGEQLERVCKIILNKSLLLFRPPFKLKSISSIQTLKCCII